MCHLVQLWAAFWGSSRILKEQNLRFLSLTSFNFSGLNADIRTPLTSSHLLSRNNRTLSATILGSRPEA